MIMTRGVSGSSENLPNKSPLSLSCIRISDSYQIGVKMGKFTKFELFSYNFVLENFPKMYLGAIRLHTYLLRLHTCLLHLKALCFGCL